MNEFRNMMETIDVPAGLEQRVLEAAETPAAPRRSYKRIAVAALAVVLVVAMGIGVGAFSKTTKNIYGYADGVWLDLKTSNAALAKGIGNIPTFAELPENFSNGFGFAHSMIDHSYAEFEDDDPYYFDGIIAWYQRGDTEVCYSLTEELPWGFSSKSTRTTIGDTTVYCREDVAYRSPDGLLRETIDDENPGEYEVCSILSVQWESDGIRYQLNSGANSAHVSMDELLDMAAELINK